MDEHVFIIISKVHKIIESKEPIPGEMRMYLAGLMEGVLEAYKDKEPLPPDERKLSNPFRKLGL